MTAFQASQRSRRGGSRPGFAPRASAARPAAAVLAAPAFALALLALLAAPGCGQGPQLDPSLLAGMAQWRDSVRVGDKRYAVPEQWRGLRLGLADQPPPADLLRVPSALSVPGREVMLGAETLLAFRAMADLAAADGVELRIQSGYRSPEEQRRLFETRLAAGRDFAEIAWGVAPPGYSEHMLGTAVDLALGGDYENNPAYLWLQSYAGEFGFHESYPPDPSGRFPWEPWHWCYRGPPAEEAVPDSIPSDKR